MNDLQRKAINDALAFEQDDLRRAELELSYHGEYHTLSSKTELTAKIEMRKRNIKALSEGL